MGLALHNITVLQGSDITFTITLKNSDGEIIDLTNAGVRGQVRASYGSDEVLLNLNPTIQNAIGGLIRVSIDDPVCSSLPVGEFVYDIEIFPTSGFASVIKVLKGKFSVLPEVTK